MRSPAVRETEEIVALYERAAGAPASRARLADLDAGMAERAGHAQRAAREGSLGQWARLAAEQARRAAQRFALRAQVERLLGEPRRWRALLNGEDTRDGLVLSELTAAVIGTDPCGTVRLWNRAAERLYGWTREEALGRSITGLTVGPQDTGVAERIMASVRASGSWEGEFWVTRHDGTRFLAYVHDVAVAADDGRPLGLVGVSIDLAPGAAAPVAATRAARG